MIGPRLAIIEMEFRGIFSNAAWTFFSEKWFNLFKNLRSEYSLYVVL
jgi:hypothetical protein